MLFTVHYGVFAQDTLRTDKNMYISVLRNDSIMLIYNANNPLYAADYQAACEVCLSPKSQLQLLKIIERTLLKHSAKKLNEVEQNIIVMLYASAAGDVKELMLFANNKNKLLSAEKIEKIEAQIKNKRKFKFQINKKSCGCSDANFYKIQFPICLSHPRFNTSYRY